MDIDKALSAQRRMRAHAATGISRASVRASASNMSVKRLPFLAQGTLS